MTEAPTDGPNPRSADFVQSLERGLAVIRAFDADDRALTLTEVARKTGLTRAAARRFLLTLVELGYVRTDGRLFSLRPAGARAGLRLPVRAVAARGRPPAHGGARRAVHESSSVSVLDGTSVVYVARVPTKRIMTVASTSAPGSPRTPPRWDGCCWPTHRPTGCETYLERADLQPLPPRPSPTATSSGPSWSRSAAHGYAIVDQELEQGLRSLAAPMHDPRGQVVAAMNVSTHVSRGSTEEIVRDLLPPLQATAAAIEADLRIQA